MCGTWEVRAVRLDPIGGALSIPYGGPRWEFNSDTLVWLVTQRLDAHPLNSDEAWARIFAVSGTSNVGTGDVFI